MPLYDENRIEYNIVSGHIEIVTDAGQRVPAYWAHPAIGKHFSAVALLHDWWGMTNVIRLLADFLAQMGYYVIAPDFFHGERATTPKEAMRLLEAHEASRFVIVDSTLSVLEHHMRTNRSVACIGLGLGGSMAFEAAIMRHDLEAAVAVAGFPQRYLGRFAKANTPILALYGSEEPYIKPVVIEALRKELASTELADQHRVEIIKGASHVFFTDTPTPAIREVGRLALKEILAFLEIHLEQPQGPAREEVI